MCNEMVGAHILDSVRTHDQKHELQGALMNDLVKPQLSNGPQETNFVLSAPLRAQDKNANYCLHGAEPGASLTAAVL